MRQNENDQNEGFSNEQSKAALQSLKSLSMEPSPFLKTRVLAQMRERKQSQVGTVHGYIKKYFMHAGLATAFIFVVTFSFLQNKTVIPTYETGQAYVIRMDIRPYKDSKIAYAEVVLGDERVQFSSSKFAEISAQKKLTVSWDNLVEKQFLPIVIKGMSAGQSKVVVNFYDSENNLVKSQDVNLNFKGG